jgi:DNA-binding GntR family transcriptional regulator
MGAPARDESDALPGALHHSLLDRLRELIVQGDLSPGARVPERELCDRFAVSRTPLREALKVLAAEGLVELLPNRGARITALDQGALDQLFEVIGALEATAGRLAALRMSDADLAEVQALHYQMQARFLRGDLPGYFALNQAIHEAIVRGAGNVVLAATYASLSTRIRRARYMANRLSPERWQAAMAEHAAILDALLRRAGDELAALLTTHLANKSAVVSERGAGVEEPVID